MRTTIWIMAVLAYVAGTCPAADPFKPWPRNLKSHREYYDYLSDNEFDALTPGPVYYPFFIDVWRQRPVLSNDFKIDSCNTARDKDIEVQKKVFPNYKDVRFLGRTVNQLSQAGNRSALPVLKDALKQTDDSKLIGDLLRAMATFEGKVSQEEIGSYLTAEDRTVRLGAAALYAVQSYAKAETLLALADKESGQAKVMMVNFAAKCKNPGDVGLWKPFLENEATAMKAVLGLLQSSGGDALAMDLSAHPSPAVRFVFASNHRLWPKTLAVDLLKRMAKDSLSTVQAEVAEAIGVGRHKSLLPELHALAAGSTASVRRQAAISFRHFPSDKTFAALTTLTGDSRFQVRDAAKDSMLAMAGTYDVDAAIAANMKRGNVLIRYNAYLVSLALGSTRHAALLAQTVPKETDAEALSAGIDAWVFAGGDAGRSFVIGKAQHKSVLVRISVAKAIGRQRWKQHYGILRKCIRDVKAESDYRLAAITAMGVTEDSGFSPDLLWVLKNILKATSDHRAAAAWSAARLPNPSKPLRERLFQQVVSKVIPGPPPSFDAAWVRASATMALNVFNKRGISETTRLAKGSLSSLRGGGKDAPNGPNFDFYVDQIVKFIADKPIGNASIRPMFYSFSFRKARRPIP